MKQKRYKQKSDGAMLLRISLDKKDVFNYVMAMRLSANQIKSLLPFSFNENSVLPELFYNITDLATLKTLLETKLSLTQFQSLLKQVALMLEALSINAMPERNIIFDPTSVFVRLEDLSLQFVYLPLDSRPINDRAVLDLLSYLAAHVRFVVEDDRQYVEKLTDYIKRQNIFSLVDLKAFLGLDTSFGRNAAASQPLVDLSDENITQIETRSKRRVGRDFVTDASGVQTKDQRSESQSVAENILTAISEDLDNGAPPVQRLYASPSSLGSDATATGYSPKQLFLVREQDGVSWPISGLRVILGRSQSAQLQVSESLIVSRQHAALSFEGNSITLEDLGSSNGTYINSRRLAPHQRVHVLPGDKIMLGDQVFSVSC